MGRKKPGRKAESTSKRSIAWPKWTGFGTKTIWDWLQLLVVPLALAVIGFWFTAQQDTRQQLIEEQRADDAALQAYLDQMSDLMIGENQLRNSEEDSEVRTLARARTLTVLRRLDASRKAEVTRFLDEAGLIQGTQERDPIILLYGADLSSVELTEADLIYADLTEANLSDANLVRAIMLSTYLADANLRNADLRSAVLDSATPH